MVATNTQSTAPGVQLQRAVKVVRAVCVQFAEFLIPFATVRPRMIEDPTCETMYARADGVIGLNPADAAACSDKELAASICHEILHLVLRHHDRVAGRNPKLWNIAADWCINDSLRQLGMQLPAGCIFPTHDYRGELSTEAVYDWLLKNPQSVPQISNGKNGQGPRVGGGCGVKPAPTAQPGQTQVGQPSVSAPMPDIPNWDHIANEARAWAQKAGRGSSPVVTLLQPKQPRQDWRKVLRYGAQRALSSQQREISTYSRAGRRNRPGIVTPGKVGTSSAVAVVLDVSGSMHAEEWLSQMVAEAKALQKFLGVRIYLAAHTSEVVFADWADAGNIDTKLRKATQYSGGTDAQPAYNKLRSVGVKFDGLIHFTDCELCSDRWPDVPAKRLIVGAFGNAANGPEYCYTKPPTGATLIPCVGM